MKRALFLLPILSASFCFSEPTTDQALQALLRVKAAAEAARHVAPARAAHLNSVPYDARGAAPEAVAVPAGDSSPKTFPFSSAQSSPETPAPLLGKFSGGYLGLYSESDLTLTTGRCADCNAPKEGMWYFLDEVVAVPKAGPPSLVWIGSREMIEGAYLSADGRAIKLKDGTVVPLSLVPKIASNLSFYDEATTAHLQNRPLRLRGEFVEGNGVRRFVARTIWPEDLRVDFAALKSSPAKDKDDITELVKSEDGGAKGPFRTELLWERETGAPGRSWAGKPVMGVMLNGSQGDDDETHGGHLSFFAGRLGPNGEMADWLFSNFYDMDQNSEKGILPGLVPLDKYMADLNSGQSYYRPSDILVAVLKDDKPARFMQDKYKALYAKYYAHEVLYNRTTKSCAGLIVDELRDGGWNIPKTGPSNVISARLLSTLVAIGSWDRKKGAAMYASMRQEKTRLFPRAAFESVGEDLVTLGEKPGRKLTPFEQELADDLEAVLFVRLPQLPSSRAYGSFPVESTEEYFHRVPMKTSKWKVGGATSPRPFPPPH